MKLIYRGVSYDYNPASVEVIEEGVAGHYRGLEWRFRNPKKAPVLQTNLDLRYRGVPYQTGQASTARDEAVPAIETVSVQTQIKSAPSPSSTQALARSLMVGHHNSIKSRQQSLLGRVAAEVGLGPEATKYWNHIQGKVHPSFRSTYDRSRAAAS